MNRLLVSLAGWIVAGALLALFPAAMPIYQFDRMAAADRQDYMNLLVVDAQKVLTDEGRRDSAARVYQLFNEVHPGNECLPGQEQSVGDYVGMFRSNGEYSREE